MATEHNDVPGREERLSAVLVACLEAIDAGRPPDRAELLARYPDLAAELSRFLDDQDRVDRCAAPLRAVARAAQARDATAGDSLPGPADSPAGSPAGPTHVPPSFGDYELLAELGRGGMGVVYRARQRSPHRLVALKTIRLHRLESPAEVERFRAEAEAAASLDHPNIVPIYEVGEHDGRPFFSMKLVEGGSLAGQLDRYTKEPKAAARLLTLVARAVYHAHQRGILHRDLKPSNILLDPDGQPHVTDFGLAKRFGPAPDAGAASLTETGAIVGTPTYMAPEQASGKKGAVTTATDVYGLGCLLYALLTGRAPFDAETPLETLAQVSEREPEPPSRINRRVDRDLETICLKCLEKEPARRYGSAEAVAEDLERWLKGEPIQARAIGPVARFWRWCQRNPVGACLIVTAALAVVVLAVSTVLIWREKEQTRTALAEAQANYARAQTNQERADKVAREAFWALQDILCPYDPGASVRPLTVADLRQWQTQEALRFLVPYCEDSSDDPWVRTHAAAAYVHTGRVYQALGEREKADRAFRQAVVIYRGLIQDSPDNAGYLWVLATALRILAENRYDAGELADADGCYRQAVGAWRKAIRMEPTSPEPYVRLADMLCHWFDPQLREPFAALELSRKAVELAPEDPEAWLALGAALYRTDQCVAVEEPLRKAMQWPEVPHKWGWHRALLVLAMAQWRLRRYEDAIEAYRQAERRMESCFRQRDIWDRTLRAEAADLLGIREEQASKPKEEMGRQE